MRLINLYLVSIGYNANCEDDNQCAWLLGKFVCVDGSCRCENGWNLIKGRCVLEKKIGESCSSNDDCFNGYDFLSTICKNGYCNCNDNYYLRGNYDCRLIGEGNYNVKLNFDSKLSF